MEESSRGGGGGGGSRERKVKGGKQKGRGGREQVEAYKSNSEDLTTCIRQMTSHAHRNWVYYRLNIYGNITRSILAPIHMTKL